MKYTENMEAHKWDVRPKEAVAIQQKLREKVVISALKKMPRLIAGADVSLNLYSTTVHSGFVVMQYPTLDVVDHASVTDETTFPYIPGLLSFREIPSLLKAWEKLTTKPDLVIVDGIGIAHPRRFGIASHLGVLLEIPTIGCAKSVLTGVYNEPPLEAGTYTYLHDSKTGEIIGAAVRTKYKVKPVFISPGHKITLAESIKIILACTRKYRLPEPTRMAHNVMNNYRKGEQPKLF